MLSQDPLDKWYFYYTIHQKEGQQLPRPDAKLIHDTMDKLAAFLEKSQKSKEKKVSFDSFRYDIFKQSYGRVHIDDQELLAKIQQVYRNVFHARGSGINSLQESLLELIAQSTDPSTIPFWQELLDFKRQYDSFAKERKKMALAALAFIALVHNDTAAYAALQQAIRHTNPTVREEAIVYLTRCYMMQDKELPKDVQVSLKDIATSEKVFLPRFFARMALWCYDLDVPLDNPNGVYELKVSFWHDTQKHMYRTIAIRSEQTLEDLHLAIQDELDWDDDHLYTFFVTGRKYNDPYEFANPSDPEAEFYTTEAVIGYLGLLLKHTFVYLFDYGDMHLFSIEVVGIRPHSDDGDDDYPRVIDSKGNAPTQYPMLDDDDDDDELFIEYINEEDFDDDDDFDDEFNDEEFDDTFNGELPDNGGSNTYKNNGTHI